MFKKILGHFKTELQQTKEYYQAQSSNSAIKQESADTDEVEMTYHGVTFMAPKQIQNAEYQRKRQAEKYYHPASKQQKSEAAPIFVSEEMHDAAMIIFRTGNASVSMLQREMHLNYSKAAAIIDRLEEACVIGPFTGTTPRKICISKEEYLKRMKIESAVVDIAQIIQDENEWRRQQRGLSPIEDELEKIDHMDGHAFEHWCANLLRKNCFTDVTVTPGSGDQGVDVLAVKDGIHYAIQCKCYFADLGNTPVQEVYAGKEMYGCQVGVVMTNRHFTDGAKQLAEKTRVLLWDREKLIELLEQAQ